MSTIVTSRIGSPKVGGLALIISSILLAAGNTLLISVHRIAGTNQGIEAYARGITEYINVWHLAHSMLTLAPAIWMFGLLTLYGVLVDKGERSFSLAALLSLSIATIAQIIGAVEGGFVTPILGQNYLTTSGATQEAIASILDYSRLLTLTLAAFGILLEVLGTGLFGTSLRRAKLYNKWLAWAGVFIGLTGVLGYLAGIFGPYWISSLLFLPLGVVSSIWLIALGIFLYRDQR